jgi:hypothetical protein
MRGRHCGKKRETDGETREAERVKKRERQKEAPVTGIIVWSSSEPRPRTCGSERSNREGDRQGEETERETERGERDREGDREEKRQTGQKTDRRGDRPTERQERLIQSGKERHKRRGTETETGVRSRLTYPWSPRRTPQQSGSG